MHAVRCEQIAPKFSMAFVAQLGQAHCFWESVSCIHRLLQSGQLDLPWINPFLCLWPVTHLHTLQQLKYKGGNAYQELTALCSAMLWWQL